MYLLVTIQVMVSGFECSPSRASNNSRPSTVGGNAGHLLRVSNQGSWRSKTVWIPLPWLELVTHMYSHHCHNDGKRHEGTKWNNQYWLPLDNTDGHIFDKCWNVFRRGRCSMKEVTTWRERKGFLESKTRARKKAKEKYGALLGARPIEKRKGPSMFHRPHNRSYHG